MDLFKNKEVNNIPKSPGQLIFANISGVNIDGITFNNVGIGLQMGYSSNFNITNCDFINNTACGLYTFELKECKISQNNFHLNYYGIVIGSGKNISIKDNNLSNNTYGGIKLQRINYQEDELKKGTMIDNNICQNNGKYGINILSSYNYILNNNISNIRLFRKV